MAGDLPWVGAPTSSTCVRVPFIITWPLDREVPSFPIACEIAVSQYSTAKKTFTVVSTFLGREGLSYLVSRNGKPALTIWREIAKYPSRVLFLITSVEQMVQTGMKHTGLSWWGTGFNAGQVLRSKERQPTSSPRICPPPCTSLVPVNLDMSERGVLSEWIPISRLSRCEVNHSTSRLTK